MFRLVCSLGGLLLSLSQPAAALAAGITNPALEGDLGNSPDPAGVLGRIFGSVWGTAYIFGGIIFLLYLIWGGIEWAIAGSNKDRVEHAKDKMTNAFFGLAIVAGSYAIIQTVGYVFGVDILKNLTISIQRLSPFRMP